MLKRSILVGFCIVLFFSCKPDRPLSTVKEITAFSFTASNNAGLSDDIVGIIADTTITVTVPFGTDVTALISSFITTGVSITVNETVQTSGITANDFTTPLIYKVIAEDGSVKNYTVTVIIIKKNDKDISSFGFLKSQNDQLPYDIEGTITNTSIEVTVPLGTDLSDLKASFITTGVLVKIVGTEQVSGTTSNNFTRPIYYIVIAEDSSTKTYVVTVTVEKNTDKDFSAFKFDKSHNTQLSSDCVGVITDTIIDVAVPIGTDLTGLIASFSITGIVVTVNGKEQTSDTTTNDFSHSLTYTITAEDGSTKDYSVTVTAKLTRDQLIQMIENGEDVTNVDTSGITNMSRLFEYNASFNQDISSWDVSNVTDMSFMFKGASTFNQPIGNWNVSKVTNMTEMFYGAAVFNQPIDSWVVSIVTDMSFMFNSASAFNQPIGSWNVSNVTDMSYMFYSATLFNQDISEWNVSNVTDMSYMFHIAKAFDQPISNWNVSKVTNMSDMFSGLSTYDEVKFNQDISKWDVSNVTDMCRLFYRNTSFNQDISKWNVSNVTNMQQMFNGASAFNQPIGIWDVSNVTNMILMFGSTDVFNQPIGNWNVLKVETMRGMFNGANVFNQPIGNWNVSNVTDMSDMFGHAATFNQPIGSWNVSNVTNMKEMFYEAAAFNQDISGWEDYVLETIEHSYFSGGTCPLTTDNHPYATWNE